MSLPYRVQKLINEYAKPITRPNWRKGSKCGHIFKDSKLLKCLHVIYLENYKRKLNKEYELIVQNSSFSEDLNLYGENIYKLSPNQSTLGYNNFYFILRRFKMIQNTNQFKISHIIEWSDEDKVLSAQIKIDYIKEGI